MEQGKLTGSKACEKSHMAEQLCILTQIFAWIQFPYLSLFRLSRTNNLTEELYIKKDLDKDFAHGKYYTKCELLLLRQDPGFNRARMKDSSISFPPTTVAKSSPMSFTSPC